MSDVVTKNLEIMRKVRGFNKSQLADKAKVSLRALNYYLDGERTPPLDALESLAKALTIPTEAMLDEDLAEHYASAREAGLFRKRYLKASEHQKRVIMEVLKEDLSTPPGIPTS